MKQQKVELGKDGSNRRQNRKKESEETKRGVEQMEDGVMTGGKWRRKAGAKWEHVLEERAWIRKG